MTDICWIPEVPEVIIDGTDVEFQDREADIRSRISELSATWLEERRKALLEFLPQESPTLEHLSLATTLFDCTNCHRLGMRVEQALSHNCHFLYRDERFATFSNAERAMVSHYDVDAPWDLGLTNFRYSANLSALVREIVIECGENPDAITAKEMNRKIGRAHV